MKRFVAALALSGAGCVSQADVDRAARDQLEFSTRLMGYALESNDRALETHRALLAAFPPDSPAHAKVVELLGDEAALEARRVRLAADRNALLERGRDLRQRYGASSERE
ncbi:MAG: hypothetical protein KDD82_12475 [Planctomycetes bacterium]|nr:hypothetical protein [Planctomycetota bacterium]